VTDDAQDIAEAFDQDKVNEIEDYTGDVFGDGVPAFPPDRPVRVNTVGVTAAEDAGESFAERTLREMPDVGEGAEFDVASEVGQLVEPDASSLDTEPQQVADAEPGEGLTAEKAAMHIEQP